MTAQTKATILLVDDQLDNLTLLSQMLTSQGYRVKRAADGAIAFRGARAAPPDLMLLDINMPTMDGYTLCEKFKQDPITRDIPIIFISALDSSLDKVRAFSVGGVDYISKPFEMPELLARVKNHLALQMAKAEISKLNAQLEQRVKERTSELEIANQALKEEICKRQDIQDDLLNLQDELLQLAWHDPLTNLWNRAYIMKQIKRAIHRAKQNKNYQFALLFLDCNRFKVINDSLGHMVGDRLLVSISARLKECLLGYQNISFARFGGDEFIILLSPIESAQDAETISKVIHLELTTPFQLDQHSISMNVSIGIVYGNQDYEQADHLLRDADTAMYRAKAAGQAQYQVFDSKMHEQAVVQLQLEMELRRTLEENAFSVYYQPIFSFQDKKIKGLEALIRWKHPEKGSISPATFIPIAEETGMIIPIGIWILKQVCYQLKTWLEHHPSLLFLINKNQFKININLSVKQFKQPDLIDCVDCILEDTGIPGHCLKFEITESAIIDDLEIAIYILKALKKRDIQLAIDDFGTGYSSLSYLYKFPVDTVKLDQSFIQGIRHKSDSPVFFTQSLDMIQNMRIIAATINLAHDLGINIVAEGIETEQQFFQLKKLDCDLGQGYWFSKPVSGEEAKRLLLNQLNSIH